MKIKHYETSFLRKFCIFHIFYHKLCICGGNFLNVTCRVTGHRITQGLQKHSKRKLLCSFFPFINLLLINFSVYLVILSSSSALLPSCFPSRTWSLWGGAQEEGRGETLGGVLVRIISEQSCSLRAAVPQGGRALSKAHSSVRAPGRKLGVCGTGREVME